MTGQRSQSDTPADHAMPLWRQRNFRLLWGGQSISTLGSQITTVALPLVAAITLHATPAHMATLQALQYAPPALISLFAGVIVDRMQRQPAMIVCDLLSAGLLLAVPLAFWNGRLGIELVYAVTLALGVVGVFRNLAGNAWLPGVVPRASLPAANSAFATSSSTARVVGPGLGGLAVQWFGAPFAVVLDAISFAVAAGATAAMTIPAVHLPAADERQAWWREMRGGLAVIVHNPYLRAFVLASASFDVFWNALYAVYILYVTRTLGLPPAAIGLLLSVGSGAALVCAPLAAPLVTRFGLGRSILLSQIVIGVGSILIVLAGVVPAAALGLLIAAEVVQVAANTVSSIGRESVRQAVTPDQLRGRAGAATMFLGFGAALLGTILGGLFGQRAGVPATILFGALGGLGSFIWLWRSPVRTLRSLADVEHDRPIAMEAPT